MQEVEVVYSLITNIICSFNQVNIAFYIITVHCISSIQKAQVINILIIITALAIFFFLQGLKVNNMNITFLQETHIKSPHS